MFHFDQMTYLIDHTLDLWSYFVLYRLVQLTEPQRFDGVLLLTRAINYTFDLSYFYFAHYLQFYPVLRNNTTPR